MADACCKFCGTTIVRVGTRGRLPSVCEPCRPKQRYVWRLTEQVRYCVDCGDPIDKPRESRRRTCTSCRAARDVARIARNRAQGVQYEARQKAARAERTAARRVDRPWLQPGKTRRELDRLRRQLNPMCRVQQQISKRLRGRDRGTVLRRALVEGRAGKGYTKALGYTVDQLRVHLERQFTAGMSWDRFAAGEIHIDHRLPLAGFDLTDPVELKAAWALTNLQPLWAPDNSAKGARRLYLL